MRLTRPAVALATLACVAGGVSAHAATKPAPVCNLITDPAGDANDPTTFFSAFGRTSPTPNDGQTDILAGDFAVDAKTVTAVIKLAQAPGLDPTSPQGDFYYFIFQPAGAANRVYLSARTAASGAPTFVAGAIVPDATTGSDNYTDNATVPVKGKLDGSTFTITAKLSDFKALADIKSKNKINALEISSFGVADAPVPQPVGDQGLLINGDDAVADKAYVAGTPSCVKPVS